MNRDDDEIKCGELYCERCGDCYTCYADETCINLNGHYFPFGDLEKNEPVEGEKS